MEGSEGRNKQIVKSQDSKTSSARAPHFGHKTSIRAVFATFSI